MTTSSLGHRRLAEQFADETDPAVRDSLLEAEVTMVYRKDLGNLSLQHTRLRRHRDVVTKELTDLQTKRKEATRHQSMRTAKSLPHFHHRPRVEHPFDHTDFGSEFSLEQMFASVAVIRRERERMRFPEITRSYYIDNARQNSTPVSAKRKPSGLIATCETDLFR